MRHASLWIIACAALGATAAPAPAAGEQRPSPPAAAAGGELAPPVTEPAPPPPLPPGPEWRESVSYAVPGDAVAACLRAAGPGQLTLFGGGRGDRSTIELLEVAADGLRAGAATEVVRLAGCPEVGGADAPQPPLLAIDTVLGTGRRAQLVRQVTAPGGRPQTLTRGRYVDAATLATAPGGAAALAWSDQPPNGRSRLLVATRPPGATRFGRLRLVATRIDDWSGPALGIDRRGRAHVAWVEATRSESGDSRLHVASSDPSGRFGRPQKLGRTFGFLGASSLAVAPNGRALLVDPGTGSGSAWELAPGARRFAKVPLPDVGAEEPVVTVTDAGAAVLAYRSEEGVTVLRRPAGGRFGGLQELHVPVEEQRSDILLFGGGDETTPGDRRAGELRVALSGSGEIVLAWTTAAVGGTPAGSQVAHGTLAGGMSAPRQLGGACRATSATTPLVLADGRLAVAWSDNARAAAVSDSDWPIGGGQLHVALPAAPGAGPAPGAAPAPDAAPTASPTVTASVLGDGRIASNEPLRLRVDCGGLPCDVRAAAQARRVGPRGIWPAAGAVKSAATTTVAAGASAELELEPLTRTSFVPPEQVREVPIELVVCAPGGPVVARTTVRARLRGRPLPPAPRIVGLRAERRGRRVVVTWRTTAPPVRGSAFYLVGTAPSIGDSRGSESVGQAAVAVRGARRRFRAVIEPEEGRLPRTVIVMLSTAQVGNAAEARVTVR